MASFKPSDVDLDTIIDMQSICDYNKLSGVQVMVPGPITVAADGQPTPGEPVPGQSPLVSFLAYCEMEPQSHFRNLAILAPADYGAFIAGWRINGIPPSLPMRGVALTIHKMARCICSLEDWPAPQPGPAAAAAAVPHGGTGLLTNGSVLLNTPIVRLEEVVGPPGNCEQITFMLDSAWLAARAQYNKVMEQFPHEEVDITAAQLSALKHLIDTDRPPYADFACFGKYGARIAKKTPLIGK